MTKMLIAIKPNALSLKNEIYSALETCGIYIVSKVTIKCSEDIYDYLYSDLDKHFDAANRDYLLNNDIEISVIQSKLSYPDILRKIGQNGDPNLCDKNSLRYKYGDHKPMRKNGVNFYFNAIHKSSENSMDNDIDWFYNNLQLKHLYNIVKEISINNNEIERFKFHIEPVLKNSQILASELNANYTICEINALCHDVSKLQKIKDNHEIFSALWAKTFLTENKFPDHIVHCVEKSIISHRNNFNGERVFLEEKILATADAMSHIDYPLPILRNIFNKTSDLQEVKSVFIQKLERSYLKIYFKKREYKNKIKKLKEILK